MAAESADMSTGKTEMYGINNKALTTNILFLSNCHFMCTMLIEDISITFSRTVKAVSKRRAVGGRKGKKAFSNIFYCKVDVFWF